MLGAVQQFSGFYRFKSLLGVLVPALCVLHAGIILMCGWLLSSRGHVAATQSIGFVASGCFQFLNPGSHHDTIVRTTCRLLCASLVTFVWVLWIVLLNVTAPSLYDDGCLDYGIWMATGGGAPQTASGRSRPSVRTHQAVSSALTAPPSSRVT